MSGLGLFEAQLNGAKLTDEVLAPGYSNYQLSAEYRTYDVTGRLRGGANTLGVELGQGTAHNVKMANPAVGRTNSFAWWNSSAVGSGTLTAPASAGDTNVKVSSVASYYVGGTINVDTGDGGERLESRTITSIGTAPTSTPLALRPRPPATRTSRSTASPAWPSAASSPIGSADGDDHLGGHRGDQHDARGRFDDRRAGHAAAVAAGRELDLERGRRLDRRRPGGHDLHPPDVQRRRPAGITRAQLRINGDDSHVTYVNGQQVAQSGTGNNAWQTSQIVDIKSRLVAGTNVIAIAAHQRRQLRQHHRRGRSSTASGS